MTYVVTNDSISITLKNKVYTLQKSHLNFNKVKEAIKSKVSEEELMDLVDIKQSIFKFSEGKVKIEGEDFYYGDRILNNALTKRIVYMIKEGFTVEPLTKFLDNLMLNPSARAVNEFYEFLEKNKLPITDDGEFLAYKKIRGDWLDIYSASFNNAIGEVVEMERNAVDDEKNNCCSYGLHFASIDYMSNYGTSDIDDRVVIVKINPRDVVSFPIDYNRAKGRCCRYEVVDEIKNDGSEIKSYFITSKEYGTILDILNNIKKTVKETYAFEVKFLSNLHGEGMNNYSIRELLKTVQAQYNIEIPYSGEIEDICVKDIIQYILDETK